MSSHFLTLLFFGAFLATNRINVMWRLRAHCRRAHSPCCSPMSNIFFQAFTPAEGKFPIRFAAKSFHALSTHGVDLSCCEEKGHPILRMVRLFWGSALRCGNRKRMQQRRASRGVVSINWPVRDGMRTPERTLEAAVVEGYNTLFMVSNSGVSR